MKFISLSIILFYDLSMAKMEVFNASSQFSTLDKWKAENVIRNLEHIKEDVGKLIKLSKLGRLSLKEMAFYMIKMHDFDNNGGLDGIEIRAALVHEELHAQNPKQEDKEEIIEFMLKKYDDDNNGVINYGELISVGKADRHLCIIMFLRFLILLVCHLFLVDLHDHGHAVTKQLETLEKWKDDDIIRDVEHIKEDLEKVIELSKLGQMSKREVRFYMIRMHDFDDNGGLDGIELRTVLQHTEEHLGQSRDKEEVIDSLLKYDDDNNGIIDYGEFVRHVDGAK